MKFIEKYLFCTRFVLSSRQIIKYSRKQVPSAGCKTVGQQMYQLTMHLCVLDEFLSRHMAEDGTGGHLFSLVRCHCKAR
jgi:hypothetical protein